MPKCIRKFLTTNEGPATIHLFNKSTIYSSFYSILEPYPRISNYLEHFVYFEIFRKYSYEIRNDNWWSTNLLLKQADRFIFSGLDFFLVSICIKVTTFEIWNIFHNKCFKFSSVYGDSSWIVAEQLYPHSNYNFIKHDGNFSPKNVLKRFQKSILLFTILTIPFQYRILSDKNIWHFVFEYLKK